MPSRSNKLPLDEAKLAALLLCVFADFANAAPVIQDVSGTPAPGGQLQISGTGFGTKSNAAPKVWDDFELGKAGVRIAGQKARIGNWDAGAGSEYVTYSNERSLSGTVASKHDFKSFYNASLAKNFAFGRLYMDFWINPVMLGGESRDWKLWRLYGENDELQLAWTRTCSAPAMSVWDLTTNYVKSYWGSWSYQTGQWYHVQLLYQESAPDTPNGSIHHYIDSVVQGIDSDNVETRTSNSHFNEIRIGHFWANDTVAECPNANPGAYVYVDDVYIDTSWARVELGDAPTYSKAQHRAIQIPTAWSTNSISITFNPGAFKSDAQLFLFVVDETNTASKGIPINLTPGTPIIPKPQPPSITSVK